MTAEEKVARLALIKQVHQQRKAREAQQARVLWLRASISEFNEDEVEYREDKEGNDVSICSTTH